MGAGQPAAKGSLCRLNLSEETLAWRIASSANCIEQSLEVCSSGCIVNQHHGSHVPVRCIMMLTKVQKTSNEVITQNVVSQHSGT